MKGYTGKILHVDLSTESFTVEEPEERFYRKYMGGGCIGAYYLIKETKPKIDPLSPENVIVFSIGPGTGSSISGASRHCVTTKSPQTGTIGTGEAGGYWGPALRFAGFDSVVVKGRSEKPVYLLIVDGKFCLKDASRLWGKTTKESQNIIRQELNAKKARCLLIGPGGENLVKYANISNELSHFNGRNGMGAVMGSKKLKGVVVIGTQKPMLHDQNAISELAKKVVAEVKAGGFYTSLKKYGTAVLVNMHQETGNLPTKNWNEGVFEFADDISGERLRELYLTREGTCWACAQSCKRIVGFKTDSYEVDADYGGPEYETIGMCGSNLGIKDLAAVCKINELCNMYTLDTISFGGAVGFVMECFEKGIITVKDTDGFSIKFGDGDTVIKLVEMTAKRIGFGNILAEGTPFIAEKFGGKDLAVFVKGKEFPAHMPQAKAVLALTYACNPFGPDHNSVEHDPVLATNPLSERIISFGFDKQVETGELGFEKAKLLAYTNKAYSLIDTLSVCQLIFNFWTILDFNDLVEFVNACTGWRTNLFELIRVGEHRTNLFKIFNMREGFTADDDDLPKKMFKPLSNNGPTGGRSVNRDEFIRLKSQYYRLSGWDPDTGHPTELKIKELGIEWVYDFI